MVSNLENYWFARYQGWDATRWVDQVLKAEVSDRVRMEVSWTGGWAAFTRAEYEAAESHFEVCRSLAEQAGDRRYVAWAFYGLGRVEQFRRPEAARRLLDEATEIFSELGDVRGRAECQLAVGYVAALAGDTTQAPQLLSSALEALHQDGLIRSISIGRQALSMVGWYSDDPEAALRHAEAAVELARRSDDRPATCGALTQRAVVRYRWGDQRLAAKDLLEAMSLVPLRNDIDSCWVLTAATGLVVDAGQPELACTVIDHVERVTRAVGWGPVADWLPALDELRQAACEQLEGRFDPSPTTTVAVARDVRSALEALVQ